MTKNWHMVNVSPNKENPLLSDDQICNDLSIGSPAINFYASDPSLLVRLLADAEVSYTIEELKNYYTERTAK